MVMVAVEQQFPAERRILNDPLAARLLPFGLRVFLGLIHGDRGRDWMVRSSEKSIPGIWSAIMCRKLFIDEKLTESTDGIEAVVNLGAGYDTRAFRLRSLADIPVWEVDQPRIIHAKRSRLKQLTDMDHGSVDLVPLDFDRQAMSDVLLSYGYSPGLVTFFIMEGVTQYLTEAGLDKTFGFLSRATPGSRFAFTYVREDFIEGRKMYGQEALYRKWVTRGKTWLSGMAPNRMDEFLAKHGWRVLEHSGYDDLAERYVRPTGRNLASPLPVERLVLAEKA